MLKMQERVCVAPMSIPTRSENLSYIIQWTCGSNCYSIRQRCLFRLAFIISINVSWSPRWLWSPPTNAVTTIIAYSLIQPSGRLLRDVILFERDVCVPVTLIRCRKKLWTRAHKNNPNCTRHTFFISRTIANAHTVEYFGFYVHCMIQSLFRRCITFMSGIIPPLPHTSPWGWWLIKHRDDFTSLWGTSILRSWYILRFQFARCRKYKYILGAFQ
jgi:hypothetical protein